MSNITFRPVRGKDSVIQSQSLCEGNIYFASDTGKIYLDTSTERVLMGGAGASIYYGIATGFDGDEDTKIYNYPINGLEDSSDSPKEGDIILNGDGRFFRILAIYSDYYKCALLAVSGSGTGGGGGSSNDLRPFIKLEELDNYNLINGQDARVYFTATSAEANGVPLAKSIVINWTLGTMSSQSNYVDIYYKGQKTVTSGEMDYIDFGKYLRDSSTTQVVLTASAVNHTQTFSAPFIITTSELRLTNTSDFSPTAIYKKDNVVLKCNAIGNIAKILDFYFDDELVNHKILDINSEQTQSYAVPMDKCTHGVHRVRIELYQSIDGNYGLGTDPIQYEIPIVDDSSSNNKPIIWLGDYKNSYYNYDIIRIPFLVYDPADTSQAIVHLYKNRIELQSSPRTIKDLTGFSYWEIADADLDQLNYYQISCGEDDERKVEREITFTVSQDPNRTMEVVKQNNLKLNFDPAGRSNDENASSRQNWSYIDENGNEIKAKFENFNWTNNGWHTDTETNSTCLRISNGAKFSIPIANLVFASSVSSQQSNSIELRLKIRNIQNYNKLITNITRYNGDANWYQGFLEQNKYTNYDAYLQATLTPDEYEALEFSNVQKNINLDNLACGFYTGSSASAIGVCVGPQDAFFSNGSNTVNESFVENEIISLSFVYSHSLKLLFIYINGVITGVIKSAVEGSFAIDSGAITFEAKNCDIDLYKIRIYNTELNVNDICINYAVDTRNIITYDQNKLAEENLTLKEYQLKYNNVIAYNEEHPNDPLMPYIIFDSSNLTDNKLPYSKKESRKIKFEFVNTPLEQAYTSGELETLAKADGLIAEGETDSTKIADGVKTYYKHHCPSFVSYIKNSDLVTISVQGTSSEFYPRRNFKIKTKVDFNNKWNEETQQYDAKDGINLFMNRGPYEEIYRADSQKLSIDNNYLGYEESRLSNGWYLNNYTNPTTKWTLKVDYMESSGSYNAGYAGLVANSYTKHPLQDYLGVINNTELLQSPVAGMGMRWQDYRTSVLGFPVMAFQKRADGSYLFIGYYRMLLDKGSDECYGFKTPKKMTSKILKDKNGKAMKMRDVAECWEFSTNSRTFCSFRDPWNRVELSFKAPSSAGNGAYTASGGPVVMNHYEYRYNTNEDYIDALMEFDSLTQTDLDEITNNLGVESIVAGDREAGQNLTLSFYKNWEKANKWVWSTNLDNVISQGEYFEAPVGKVLYEPNKFYILTDNGYVLADGEFNRDTIYYSIVIDDILGETYKNAFATSAEYLYQPNKFYQYVSGAYSLISDAEFNDTIQYYEFVESETYRDIADLLVSPATGEFNSNTEYYLYDGTVQVNPTGNTGAVTKVNEPNEGDFNAGKYYVATPVTYAGKVYTHDTKEYRSAKFINELDKHFDPEYLATYFIMTEVFECYDSRGKNCMMASWGPQEEGGEYIWYPIFYDIDTQLGINNTGIPSFEFNVDATEAGNYSTSDSILWNNFYKFFKSSYILTKYQNLRGISNRQWDNLDNPPLQSVDYIEKWYTFDPDTMNNIACRGRRPLIATNLDEYFKYITITNSQAINQGVGKLEGDGTMSIDDGGFFYALQGDRAQSRRQFLESRIEYIDSWLNQKNYARGGNNRIRGRISANNTPGDKIEDITSDKWVETSTDRYWVEDKEFGEKAHEFDAQYWLDLTPIRSSYVTAGDDSANYPSQKYDGINTVKFKLGELESGIRRSKNYPEQLLYIYGINQMADVGDMSKLYWTEFFIEGNASKLTKLKLGHDGLDKDGNKWYNKKLNSITLTPMPLLKEANFCNIGLQAETILDLSESEKLENFRATGTSKLTSVKFAKGVALNTLYLPPSVTNLTLNQANLLTDLITNNSEVIPEVSDSGELIAKKGLYLEGLFELNPTSALNTIDLEGGALGYNSYKILEQFYKIRKNISGTKLNMSNVDWCPYSQLLEGDTYDSSETYYINNGHYGFEEYTYTTEEAFNIAILNGEIYKDKHLNELEYNQTSNFTVEMLNDLYTNKNFTNVASANRPTISGIIYINNDTEVEESDIRENLQEHYPNLTFFFKNVKKAYSAKFVIYNEETKSYEYVKFKNGSTSIPSIQKISQEQYSNNNNIWFDNPYDLYQPEKTHYDFQGWSLTPQGEQIITTEEWNNQTIQSTVFDYVFYAIFTIHSYNLYFYNYDGKTLIDTLAVPYGEKAKMPNIVPYRSDADLPNIYQSYDFKGYSLSINGSLIDVTNITVSSDEEFYAIFKLVDDVRNIVHDDWFVYSDLAKFTENSYPGFENSSYSISGYYISLKPELLVQGKVVLPRTHNGQPIIGYMNNGDPNKATNQLITHVFISNSDEDCKLTVIAGSSFDGISTLKYFEFERTSLRVIDSWAFRGCSIDANTLNLQDCPLRYIGNYAFNQGISSPGPCTIILPSSLKVVNNGGFNYLNNCLGTISFEIGNANVLSDLDFSVNNSGDNYKKFWQNDTSPLNITFYSKLYDSSMDIIPGSNITVADVFGENVESISVY